MSQNKLNDVNLETVVGGVKTGDFDENGKVYIAFPVIVSQLSGYYDIDGIETLADNYYDYRVMIKPYITKNIKDAVTQLYKRNNREMSSKVKDFLGI